jgi:periplasmic protein TonB
MEEEAMGAIATQDLSRPPTVGRGKGGEPSHRLPVCIEVPVTVHGDRLSEPTRTVILFSDGAVLRLGRAVNPGQLVFLTNEHTKESVVCHVVKSKTYPNVAGYLELEFTQPNLGFWGTHFPGDPSESQSAPGATGLSQVPSMAQPLPSATPRSALPAVSTPAGVIGSINPVPLPQKAAGAERTPAPVSVSTLPAKPLAPPVPELIQPKVAPWSHTQKHAPAATNPHEDAEIGAFISRLMFEEPETELAQAAPRHSPVIHLIAAGLLLAALAGGGWLLWRHRAHETVANLSPRSANVAAVMSAPSPANPSVSAEQPAESLETPNTANEKPAAIPHFRLLRPHAKRTLSSAKNPEAAGINSVPALPSPVSLQGPGTVLGVSGSQPAAPEAARPTLNEVKTARLTSSVPPVYPPLALSLRVEGDVTLDALIEESGRITTIKALSGPAVLQKAAVAAVRQWKYEPATLNGSPVPIHLSVTVKFHLP